MFSIDTVPIDNIINGHVSSHAISCDDTGFCFMIVYTHDNIELTATTPLFKDLTDAVEAMTAHIKAIHD